VARGECVKARLRQAATTLAAIRRTAVANFELNIKK